jgi:hypothetical protein
LTSPIIYRLFCPFYIIIGVFCFFNIILSQIKNSHCRHALPTRKMFAMRRMCECLHVEKVHKRKRQVTVVNNKQRSCLFFNQEQALSCYFLRNTFFPYLVLRLNTFYSCNQYAIAHGIYAPAASLRIPHKGL